MMNFAILSIVLSGTGLFHSAQALSIPFTSSQKDQASDNTFGLQNILDQFNIYTVELTISGQKFTVSVDP